MGGRAQIVVLEVAGDRTRMAEAWAIRRRVFIEEQGVPEEIELDEDDARAIHALALQDGRPVGCGRMVAHDDYVKIGRMAVMREQRGRGIGRRLLLFLMERARNAGFRRAVLDAQLHAEEFYCKQGFVPVGEMFKEAGIMHRRMERSI